MHEAKEENKQEKTLFLFPLCAQNQHTRTAWRRDMFSLILIQSLPMADEATWGLKNGGGGELDGYVRGRPPIPCSGLLWYLSWSVSEEFF